MCVLNWQVVIQAMNDQKSNVVLLSMLSSVGMILVQIVRKAFMFSLREAKRPVAVPAEHLIVQRKRCIAHSYGPGCSLPLRSFATF